MATHAAPDGSSSAHTFRVGEWFVNPQTNRIRGPAGERKLEPRVMEVLVFLARYPGEVVTRERMLETVWNGTFVSDEALTKAIKELRKTLGDDSKHPKFIKTLPRVGYELIAPVVSEADRISQSAETSREISNPSRRPWVAVALVLVGLIAGVVWSFLNNARARRVRLEWIPEIERLVEDENFDEAFRLVQRSLGILGEDPVLEDFLEEVGQPISVETEPPGADVFVKGYLQPESDWIHLGTTPLQAIGPFAYLRWRVGKEGFETIEVARLHDPRGTRFTMIENGQSPPGMVRVPRGRIAIRGNRVTLSGFWLDRYEVTNRDYERFVNSGGYSNRDYWLYPFMENGQELSFEEALDRFRDRTGRPGPATWELGSYLDGEDDHPVRGVSWHEAAAYAEFAGKSLPTRYHWFYASGAGILLSEQAMSVSNFNTAGPAPVGSYPSLNPFGTYDMAGNVSEWTLNTTSGGSRFHAGGAWSDPAYLARGGEGAPALQRSDTVGFRCAKYDEPLPPAQMSPVRTIVWRDYAKEHVVNDDVFEAYLRLYDYGASELDAMIESKDENHKHWIEETITFTAPFGNDRTRVHLILPKNVEPPYQTVLIYPGDHAFVLEWGHRINSIDWTFFVRTGRAALIPEYTGMFGRKAPVFDNAMVYRDRVIEWTKDVSRSIDYLESRDDIDGERLAFFGVSRGGQLGPIFTAVENRFRASMLLGGGLSTSKELPPPEIDIPNFAPRSTVPTLVMNGRLDFIRPLETSVQPMFDALGTPHEHKHLALFDTGHVVPVKLRIGQILDWLDRYLGPVKTR